MTSAIPDIQLQLRSLVRGNGQLELSLVEVPTPKPAPNEVLVRIEASPLNPSDHGLLFGTADLATAKASGTHARPVITADIAAPMMAAMAGRLDQSMPVGNEGAGVVVATGDSDAARALMGKKVAILGGAMYSQYRSVGVDQSLILPEDVSVAEGASAFVNPLTALGMVETMRSEGHHALVHTAAASNLGQMLQRLCIAENVGLVNIVRSVEQEAILRAAGAPYVCNSRSADFADLLTDALVATGATLAFDATGGGSLAGQILRAMESAANRNSTIYSRYGSTVHKQVYLYGGLDPRPTELIRDFGMAWGVGGWLVMNFMQKIGPAAVGKLKQRVGTGLKTTFASRYSQEISLAGVLRLDRIAVYRQRATGQKFLINPNKVE